MESRPQRKRIYRSSHRDADRDEAAPLGRALDEMTSNLGLHQQQKFQVMALKDNIIDAVERAASASTEAFVVSEAFWSKLQTRLKEKRSDLEDELLEKISVERSIHMEKRRREMDGARRQHQELEKQIGELQQRIDSTKQKILELNST